jgi:hypothetical protein
MPAIEPANMPTTSKMRLDLRFMRTFPGNSLKTRILKLFEPECRLLFRQH